MKLRMTKVLYPEGHEEFCVMVETTGSTKMLLSEHEGRNYVYLFFSRDEVKTLYEDYISLERIDGGLND